MSLADLYDITEDELSENEVHLMRQFHGKD